MDNIVVRAIISLILAVLLGLAAFFVIGIGDFCLMIVSGSRSVGFPALLVPSLIFTIVMFYRIFNSFGESHHHSQNNKRKFKIRRQLPNDDDLR